MTMRTIYYVFLFVSLLLLLFCVNCCRWLISKVRLALHSIAKGHSAFPASTVRPATH